MTQYLRIINWWQRHSSGESRRRSGSVVEFPTRMDSEGLQILMETAKGRSAFAIYCLLAEFAGTLPSAINQTDAEGNCTGDPVPSLAGVLFDDRGPFDAGRLSRKLPVVAKVIDEALALLTSTQIGWLDLITADDMKRLIKEQSTQTPTDATSRPRKSQGKSPPANDATADTPLGALLKHLKVSKAKRSDILKLSTLTWQTVIAHMVEIKHDKSVKHAGAVLTTRLLDDQDPPPFTLGTIKRAIDLRILKTIEGVPVDQITITPKGVAFPSGGIRQPSDLPDLNL